MNIVDKIYDSLLVGDGSIITSDNIGQLNDIAMSIYEKPQLDSTDIDILKKIIMSCNILYNRTDLTILPIEDGFYDLLLEKYKKYDANFQVGSAVVEVRNLIENDISNPRTIAKSAISFFDPIERDDIHESIFSQIMRKDKQILNADDFKPNLPLVNNDHINKRTHDTEHNHPGLVGSLDKAKFVLDQDAMEAGVYDDPNVVILERDFFRKHIEEGIINPNTEIEVVVELKYDGISVEADCTNKVLSARTRGDTGIGKAADITPILKDYLFKHAECMKNESPIGVKFEAIMTNSNLAVFNKIRNKEYANCRSAIVGLFGNSDAWMYRDLITLVPLAVDREDPNLSSITDRLVEIEFLNNVFRSHGEPLRYTYFKGSITEVLYLIKCFWDEAKIARDYLDFMYDGIVVSYLDENIRQRLGRKNYINKYSIAVKFDPLQKQTIFRGYSFEVGQHGNITPMIHYDPVEFNGTIHNKSTGSSFKRFQDLALKYGDIVSVEYRNDVMPYVSRVDCAHNRDNPNPVISFIDKCPICGSILKITDSGKTIICPNNECPGRSIQRMTNMFQKMNIKGFADATFKLLGKTHLYELFDINEQDLRIALGEADGSKFFYEFTKLMIEPQKDFIIMGALGFTSIAHKKWKSILEKITIKDLLQMYVTSPEQFAFNLRSVVPNAGEVTLQTIVNEFSFFAKDIEFIVNRFNIVDSYGNTDDDKLSVRFSGFRDSNLEDILNTMNFDADSHSDVTKTTDILLIPVEGFVSTKVNKALKNGHTKIMTKDEFLIYLKDNGVQIEFF